LGDFKLQKLKRMLQNLFGAIAQVRDDARRKRIVSKSLVPLAEQRVGSRSRHCAIPQRKRQSYMDEDELIKR